MFNIDAHKAHLYPARVQQLLEGLSISPITIEVSLTSVCNQACYFCAFDYVKRRKKLPTEALLKSIQQMKHLDIKSLVFAGEGEPLMHPDVHMIIQAAHRHGIACGLSTNGVLLNKEMQSKLLPYLEWVRISVNATDRETYKKIHGKSNWEAVEYNIKTTVANKGKCTVGTQILLLPENADNFYTHLFRLSELGPDYVSIKPYSHHPFSKHTPQDENKVQGALRQLMTSPLFPKQVIFRENAFIQKQEKKKYDCCHGSKLFLFIDSWGEVYPCAQCVGIKDFSKGNIKDRLLNKIIYSEQANNVDKKIACMNVAECRKPCRLDEVNTWLHSIKNLKGHDLFL